MLRSPSGRRNKRNSGSKINLIPILDSVFIFIFFLLMSASFLKVFEISSEVPIVSSSPAPKSKKKPLALTIIIERKKISVATGVPSKIRKNFTKNNQEYDLSALKQYLINLKKRYKSENTALFEPRFDIDYDTLVKIMDSVRILEETDEDIFYTDKDGVNRRLKTLFDNIIFTNILS